MHLEHLEHLDPLPFDRPLALHERLAADVDRVVRELADAFRGVDEAATQLGALLDQLDLDQASAALLAELAPTPRPFDATAACTAVRQAVDDHQLVPPVVCHG